MKTLLTFLSLVIVTTGFFAGCQQNPGALVNNDILKEPPMAPKITADAHPAWAFTTGTFSKGKTYASVAVSDVDGTDNTAVYTCTTTAPILKFETWSPDGASISYLEMPALTANNWYTGTSYGNYAIKAVDVAVAKGVASGSNVRTIFSLTSADTMKIVSQVWCPAASGSGTIAFMVHTPNTSRIYTVPASGGSATLIYTVNLTDNRLNGNSLTCNPDGSRLAFAQYSGTGTADANSFWEIKIIDFSGTVMNTLLSNSKQITELQWSNTGANILTFCMTTLSVPTSADHDLYTIDLNAASPSATWRATASLEQFWSPDNTEIVYRGSAGGTYRFSLATGVSTLVGMGVPCGDWK